jgi:O-antigen/teichoic acid export membrane protein
MVAVLAGVAEAGRYAVAYRFLDAMLLLPSAFGSAALPVLARLSANLSDLVAAGNRCLRVVLLAVSPVVACGLIAAPALIGALGGSHYASSGDVVRVLLVGGWFSSLDIVLGLLIIVSGLQGRMLWLNVGALLTNVIGNLVVIPLFGSLGAAWMTASCEAGVLVVATLALRRLIGFRFEGAGWRPAVGALCVLAVTAILAGAFLSWPVAVALSLAIYAGVLLRSGALSDVAFLTARSLPVPAVVA